MFSFWVKTSFFYCITYNSKHINELICNDAAFPCVLIELISVLNNILPLEFKKELPDGGCIISGCFIVFVSNVCLKQHAVINFVPNSH